MEKKIENYIFLRPLKKLSNEEQVIIAKFFNSDPNKFDWKKGLHNFKCNNIEYKIYLYHDIQKRHRKSGKSRNEYRYDLYKYKNGIKLEKHYEDLYDTNGTTGHKDLDRAIYEMDWNTIQSKIIQLNDMIGYGSFGSVLRVDATMIINQDNTITMKSYGMKRSTKPPKKRVIKVQTNDLDIIMSSYEKIRLLTHIKSKMPVINPGIHDVTDTTASHTVMDEFPGEDLKNILIDENKGSKKLSLQERKLITHHLILALKNQVHAYNIVHRDIKPENIRINLSDEHNPVLIFDYDFLIKQGQRSDEIIGTLGYIPPESFSNSIMPSDIKMDIFALGRVLSKLWGISDDDFNLYSDLRKGENKISLNLFNGVVFSQMKQSEKYLVKNLISKMVHENIDRRLCLEQLLLKSKSLLKNEHNIVKEYNSNLNNQIINKLTENTQEQYVPVKDLIKLFNKSYRDSKTLTKNFCKNDSFINSFKKSTNHYL